MKKIIYSIAVCLVASQVQAQVVNSTEFYVGSNAVVSFGTDVTNEAAGKMTNNGKVHFQKNFDNRGALESAGTVVLDGNGKQLIKGEKEITFTDLKVENDARLETSLRITNSVDFRKGVIESSATSPLTFAESASHKGASDFSHAKGVVRKEGSDAFEFPLGDGTNYRSFALDRPSNAQIFTASYISKSPLNVSNAVSEDVAAINENEYWSLKADNEKASTKVAINSTSELTEVAILKRGTWQKSDNATLSAKTDLKNGVLFTMSKTREVTATLAAYPNPTEGEFFLKLAGMPENEAVKFDVVNQMGQVVMHKEGKVSDLRRAYTLPDGMPASQLSLRLIREDEQGTLSQKLILKK
jgi:hypothetical protein